MIGVLDLRGGRAVHAVAGRREAYRPVTTVAGRPIEPGDASALARTYVEDFGLAEIYVADLDAILGQDPQAAPVRELAAIGVPMWLDCGAASVEQARAARALGATRVVVGLETLPSFDVLRRISGALGADRVAFSLDLREGKPLTAPGAAVPGDEPPERLAERAAAAGVGALIVIDLSRVGTGRGPDRALIRRVRRRVPHLTLVSGGGIRGPQDLTRMAGSGCDAVLVATALHDGRFPAPAPSADSRQAARRRAPPR